MSSSDEKPGRTASSHTAESSQTHESRKLTRTTTTHQKLLDRATSHVSATDAANFPMTVDIENPAIDPAEYVTRTKTGFIDERDGVKLVTFTEDDPGNPKTWPKAKKWFVTGVVAWTCFIVALGSAIVTGDFEGPEATFGVSEEVSILQICLFVVGFGVGPIAFAPLSELFGRRPVYVVTLGLAVLFILPCMLAQNIATLIVGRMIDGIAFSAPMCLVGGSLADVWPDEERGVPMAFFSAAPFSGPAMGPLIGGAIGENIGHGSQGWNVGWRWMYYIYLCGAFATWCLVCTMPETHAPTILKKRAAKLRKETGDKSYKTSEEVAPLPLREIAKISVTRPFILLFREPIVLFMTLYMSVLYGLIYMFFLAFPVIYLEGRGWNETQTGLSFIGINIGVLNGSLISPWINSEYIRLSNKYKSQGKYPPPELRLIPMMIGCWLIPVGLFIFAWTSYPTVHWIGPIIGSYPVGFGFVVLYNCANNYIVDSYLHYAASGLAAKTFLRSMWGAGVTLFTIQMYHKLNPRWASTLLAFIALLCCAIPYVFWFKGESIRGMSKYAYTPDDQEFQEEKFPARVSSAEENV